MAQKATSPWCLLKVRLCSPFAAGLHTTCRCVVRLPSTPSSSTSQSLHARISSVSYCTYFYEFNSDIDYVQNLPRKYIRLKNFPWIIAWRRRLGFGADAR